MALLKKKQFWGTLIAVALMVYCVKDVRFADIEALYYRVNLLYLLLAILFSFLFILSKALRWKMMVSQQKKITGWRSISLYSAGQILNIVMPLLTGQVGRMFLFSKNEGFKKTFIFSTIVLEIIFDSISLLVFLLMTSVVIAFPEEYRSMSYIIGSITLVVMILLYLILSFQQSIVDFCHRKYRDKWPSLYIGIKKFLRSFVQGINLLKSSQHFFGSLGYSIAGWITHTLVVYFLLLSFGFDLPIFAAASVMIINTIALMVPITPGNAGTFEIAVSTSLAAFSVAKADAVLFALALHLLDLLPIALLGFIYLQMEKISIKDIKAEHEEDYVFDKVDEDGLLIENEENI